jgi:hypothetical protein
VLPRGAACGEVCDQLGQREKGAPRAAIAQPRGRRGDDSVPRA